MRVWIFSPVLVLVLASNALAGDNDAKEREAKRACLNGDPSKGLAILTDLFVDSGDATHIYNQGRCLEQNNRYEEAISRFREYMRMVSGKKNVDKAEKAEAEKHIQECQVLLAEKGAKPAPVAEPAQATVPGIPPVPPTPPPVATAEFPPQAPPPTSAPGSGLRVAGIVTASVGGAALIAGLVLNLKANSMVRGLAPTYNKGDDSTSQTYKTLSMVSYAVGGTCLAGGAVLYYWGWRAGHNPSIALLPSISTDGAGAVLAGGF